MEANANIRLVVTARIDSPTMADHITSIAFAAIAADSLDLTDDFNDLFTLTHIGTAASHNGDDIYVLDFA